MTHVVVGCVALLVAAICAIAVRRVWAASKASSPATPTLETGRYTALEAQLVGRAPSLQEIGVPSLEAEAIEVAPGPASRGDGDGGEVSLPLAPAIIDGALAGAGYAWTWAHVDDRLFTAVSHMTHESVDSIADLGRVAQSWPSWVQGASPTDGLINNVQGHFAEVVAAEHLGQAGHGVGVPFASNHPAWDLDVDGHLMNVKSVDEIGKVYEHLSNHPDVPVILTHDTVGIPGDAFHFDPTTGIDFDAAHEAGAMVFVDDGLSHADSMQSASDGLEVAAGHVPIHFPWATAAVSTFREGRLLFKGHTDLARAAKNVAVDTVAVGGAGALGAKAGAAIGTAIMPGVGTLFGALIGGVGAAFVGRKVANHVKRAPLEEARATFEESAASFKQEEERVQADAEAAWASFRASQADLLAAEAAQAREQADREVNGAQLALQQARRVHPDALLRLLETCDREVEALVEERLRRLARVPTWRRWLWPDAEALGAMRGHADATRFANQWRTSRAKLDVYDESVTEAAFDLAMATRSGCIAARSQVLAVASARATALARCMAVKKAAIERLIAARVRVMDALVAERTRIAAQVEEKMESPLRALKRARDHLLAELRKAGVVVEA